MLKLESKFSPAGANFILAPALDFSKKIVKQAQKI